MAKRTQTAPKSFEQALRELEQILNEIESGEIGLEESLIKYERGNFLIQYCRGVLASAEKQIEQLGTASDGSLRAQPLETQSSIAAADTDADNDDNESQS
ncbi:MAG: exodeoxyribonuclease VII small subunit [Phycisphaerales bacterium]|nr:exodeoxyribonuclease VII small subunit [Phycisphaerales bacterium]